MTIRSFVSFETDFPTDGEPPGFELASFLAAALRASGLAFSDPTDREGWAWDLAARLGPVQMETIVGLTDDGPVQWQVHTRAHLGFADRLFGRHRESRDAALRSVATALHTTLSKDPRFRSIRWYEPDVVAKGPPSNWSDTP